MDEDLIDDIELEIDPVLEAYTEMVLGERDYDEELFTKGRKIIDDGIVWSNSILADLSQKSQIPQGLSLVGQHVVRAQIAPYLRDPTPFPHSLILGPPGIGKTYLARWIAEARNEPFEEFLAPVRGEQIPIDGVILLDEAHRQGKPEFLFPMMERGAPTMLAATTRPELLDPAFASRFILRLELEPLDQEDSETLMAKYLSTDEDVSTLARASAGNPRQAEKIAKTAIALGTHDPEQVLAAVRINADGLDDLHLKILRKLRQVSRPLGVGQLAIMLYTSEQEIKEHERLLMNFGLVDLTIAGRALTKKGQQYADAV